MKIEFHFPSEYGDFRDALNLPDDHTLTDAEIEAMKMQRFESWKAYIIAASQDPGPADTPPAE